jgi:sugar/nucleoside kinase (ribokinase family)
VAATPTPGGGRDDREHPRIQTLASSGVTVLCLGEAIVDMVCEKRISSIEEADSFRPHFGGALANVAVAASRGGAGAALAAGVGDDDWGAWLRVRLEAEGVDLRWFSLLPGVRTPVAFATFDRAGEPSFLVYGEGIEPGLRAFAETLPEALDQSSALVFGSNTLVGEHERAITLRARELALSRGIPVLFDPNLRPRRWKDLDAALDLCRQICEGAFLVRANSEEAVALTGADDPGEAAVALTRFGARLGVVTRGAEGALMRGAAEAEAPAVAVEVVSTLGAGDAFMGTLAAGLATLGWKAERAAEALPAAAEAAGRACTGWGALS